MIGGQSLWERVCDVSRRALASGALLPIPTACEYLEDGGIRFPVRVMSSLKRKADDKKRQLAAPPGEQRNPFLPPDPELLVADLTATHLAVLNKFNVMDDHLLIVTRDFEDQEELLNLNDFEALLCCMADTDVLGFYNGGEAAGASQRHKHLQAVRLPLAPEGPAVPVEPFLAGARFDSSAGAIPAFRFRHAFARFDATGGAGGAQDVYRCYRMLLERAGLNPEDARGPMRQSGPYCLLMASTWMLLVPRSREFFGSISINSLGFAGSFFVKDADGLAVLRKAGPLRVLESVAVS